MSKSRYYWLAITLVLAAVIITGGIVIYLKYSPGHPIEILLPVPSETKGEIYIDGNVSNPGLYPLKADDDIASLIQAAGGIASNSDNLKLYIGDAENQPQKVNINRAEVWLLEALPGIGQTRAEAIVRYRQQNGAFRYTGELTKVEGIGTATYEQIKDLVTITD